MVEKSPVFEQSVVRQQPQRGNLDRVKERATADLRSPVTARAGDLRRPGPACRLLRRPRAGQAEQRLDRAPDAAPSASAAAVDGIRRPVSIALIPARDSPDLRASSACDNPNFVRMSLTSFSSIAGSAMIVSYLDWIVSASQLVYNQTLRQDHGAYVRVVKFIGQAIKRFCQWHSATKTSPAHSLTKCRPGEAR